MNEFVFDFYDIVKSVYPYSGSGCLIIYESQIFPDNNHIYAVAVNNGQVQSGWPVLISDLSGDQYIESSVWTEDGIYISFREGIKKKL